MLAGVLNGQQDGAPLLSVCRVFDQAAVILQIFFGSADPNTRESPEWLPQSQIAGLSPFPSPLSFALQCGQNAMQGLWMRMLQIPPLKGARLAAIKKGAAARITHKRSASFENGIMKIVHREKEQAHTRLSVSQYGVHPIYERHSCKFSSIAPALPQEKLPRLLRLYCLVLFLLYRRKSGIPITHFTPKTGDARGIPRHLLSKHVLFQFFSGLHIQFSHHFREVTFHRISAGVLQSPDWSSPWRPAYAMANSVVVKSAATLWPVMGL